ncbi:MAG: DUF4965 domain-containing protein [Clostridia bacterium]|nr:DUF4965 domain-containing protein [Clostridia bacterium]
MKLRAPSVPLITVDPYFSVWSSANKLTDRDTVHWTNRDDNDENRREMIIKGILTVDGTKYRFMGKDDGTPALRQVSLDIDAFTSKYVFEGAGIRLTASFTSPVIPTDLYYMTRPVSYLALTVKSLDGKAHKTSASVAVSEQICLDHAGDEKVVITENAIGGNPSIRMGSESQKVLWRDGDDLRIDWGYFYLTACCGKASSAIIDGMNYVMIESAFEEKMLFTFAYDDIKSIKYFGKELPSYWNKDGETIVEAIEKAFADYSDILSRCNAFSDQLFIDSVRAGGEKYAEILLLSVRQAIAAHKVAMNGSELVFISKECFSNGCAATVDVSYPSIPFFLIYNPELVRGMMRPIYDFADSDEWKFDFAPHDVGTYPIVYRQRYALTDWDDRESALKLDGQMPVEECGNMLVMEAVTAIASGDFSFADSHRKHLDAWVKYLIENGRDPANQLCTDDFAGHLAHNCNLSLKAIMGIASYGIILKNTGDEAEGEKYIEMSRDMAKDWLERAANGDGTYRLAFDKPGTFSMKYNIVWDKLLGTNIMPKGVFESEITGYKRELRPYGLPLDSRSEYTKSDWLLWTATLAENREDFEIFAEALWNNYNFSPTRVPLTDWYYTDTALMVGFQHRSVVGGHFIKLLEYKNILEN